MGFLWRRRSSLVKIVVLLSAIWFTIAFLIYSEDRRPANVPIQQPQSLELKFANVFDDVDDVDDANINGNGINAELNNVNAIVRANSKKNNFNDINSNNNVDNDSDNNNNNYMDSSIEQSFNNKVNKFNGAESNRANHVNKILGQQRNESAGIDDNLNRYKYGDRDSASDDISRKVPIKNKKLANLRRKEAENKIGNGAAADDDGKQIFHVTGSYSTT